MYLNIDLTQSCAKPWREFAWPKYDVFSWVYRLLLLLLPVKCGITCTTGVAQKSSTHTFPKRQQVLSKKLVRNVHCTSIKSFSRQYQRWEIVRKCHFVPDPFRLMIAFHFGALLSTKAAQRLRHPKTRSLQRGQEMLWTSVAKACGKTWKYTKESHQITARGRSN